MELQLLQFHIIVFLLKYIFISILFHKTLYWYEMTAIRVELRRI